LIVEAAGRGARLVMTQELFASWYFAQVEREAGFELAESVPGPTTRWLGDLAQRLGIWISGSLFERRAAGLYHNTSVMLGPDGRVAGLYRKMHIPDDPQFYEKYYFTPGDAPPPPPEALPREGAGEAGGWRVFDLPGAGAGAGLPGAAARVGSLICWDQWYPEAARLTALHGAQLLLYPTAIGYHNHPEHGDTDLADQQHDAWRTMMRSHAIANGVFVAACNRIGVEHDLTFWGGSFVCDPAGVVIAEASRDQPEALVVDCDLSMIETQRRGWPFLRDRRIDAYGGLTRRWLAEEPQA
jgi:N-carbamoylputrescine amidase